MTIFDRITRVIRANLNHWVNKAEDPEKILEQAVAEMQDDLIQLRQAVAQAIAMQKRTERQCTQAQTVASEWYRRAELALQKGDDTLAREALARRRSYQETAEAMKAQLDQQGQVVTKLKENLRVLESKLLDAKTKKDLYIARAKSAQASERLGELLNQSSTSRVLNAFEQMEEKVLQLEARSEAIAELGVDDLEKRFEALGEADDIDLELASLKANLGGRSSAQLPPS
jgi:phage shock protein A